MTLSGSRIYIFGIFGFFWHFFVGHLATLLTAMSLVVNYSKAKLVWTIAAFCPKLSGQEKEGQNKAHQTPALLMHKNWFTTVVQTLLQCPFLPPPELRPRMVYKGTLERWNDQRGFGFIKRDDGQEVFVHEQGAQRQEIKIPGRLALSLFALLDTMKSNVGTKLIFEEGSTPGGPGMRLAKKKSNGPKKKCQHPRPRWMVGGPGKV